MMLSGLPDPATAMLIIIVLVWSTALLSWVCTRAFSRMALMPDRPNARSSHTVVTPRAGGIAVVGVWALAMLAVWFLAFVAGPRLDNVLVFTGVALLAFGLGAVDDTIGLGAKSKILGQFAIAALFVFLFGGLETAPLPFVGERQLGAFGAAIAVLWIVGFMNVYNFMDGINGLVSICGNIVLCALAVAISIAGDFQWSVAALLLAVALAGFVPVNIISGRIFLGDNGSQAIGFILAALALLASNDSAGRITILYVPVAFMPFIFDVFFTLAHRFARGRRLTEAHREHLYQLLVRRGRSHINVTCIYLVLTTISCAIAMAMLMLPAAWQWIAPMLLVAALFVPAQRIYKDATVAGLLSDTKSLPAQGVSSMRNVSAEPFRAEITNASPKSRDQKGHLFKEDSSLTSRAAE